MDRRQFGLYSAHPEPREEDHRDMALEEIVVGLAEEVIQSTVALSASL